MKVEKLTSRIGARISDIDVSAPLDPATVAAITAAFHDNSVVFFTGQPKMAPEQQMRFARYFGEIEINEFQTHASVHPEVMVLDQVAPKGQGADRWHADTTYMEAPPLGAILQAHMLPPVGGDTCFASMYAAYETLSLPMQRLLHGLTAIHSTAPLLARTKASGLYAVADTLARRPPMPHPVVAVHPETGLRLLNVNSQWTTSIEGMTPPESDALLALLFEHVKSPEIQVRFRWREGDVAFWDNRCVHHYAVADYTSRRVMQRILLAGTRPVGVDETRRTPASVAA